MIVANDQVTDSQLEEAMSTYELFTDTILQTAILIESKKQEVLNITIYYIYIIVLNILYSLRQEIYWTEFMEEFCTNLLAV